MIDRAITALTVTFFAVWGSILLLGIWASLHGECQALDGFISWKCAR